MYESKSAQKSSTHSSASNRNEPFIQPSLKVGQPGDKYEVEADQMADQIVQQGTVQNISQDTFFPTSDSVNAKFQNSSGGFFGAGTSAEKSDEEEQLNEPEEDALQAGSIVRKSTDIPEEEPELQTKSDTHNDASLVESSLEASKGSGSSLSGDTKSEMESGFGADFGSVRIHTGSDAVQMSEKLNAQAFTHGNDIYFNEGNYNPATESGKHLLAHELTHTVQQGASVQRKMIQKQENDSSTLEPEMPEMVNENTFRGSEGIINKSQHTFEIPEVSIPAFKRDFTPASNLTIRRGRPEGERRNTRQRTLWDAAAREGAGLNTKLDQKIAKAGAFGETYNPVYYMKVGRGRGDSQQYLVGTRTSIRDRLLRPYWRPGGQMQLFEVDHKLEYQLSGEDSLDNLWLLEREANGSSGRNIDKELERKTNRLLHASSGTAVWNNEQAPNFREAKRNFDITFQAVNFDLPYDHAGNPPHSYSLTEIKDNASHLNAVNPMTMRDVERAGIQGSPTRLVIFNNATGGRSFPIEIPTVDATSVPFTNRHFLPGFIPTTAEIHPEQTNFVKINGQLWSSNPNLYGHGLNTYVEVAQMEGVPHTGRLNVTALRSQIEELFGSENIQVTNLSPVRITSIDVDAQGNMIIHGKIITNIPLIDNANIDLVIEGNDIRVEKTFYGSDFSIPGPLTVTNSSLTVAISTENGFVLSGEAGLEISNLAEGQISASARSGRRGGESAGFDLSGYLEFDTQLFDPARIDVSYVNKILTVGGSITIPEGKVPGIKTATLNAIYSENNFNASGDAELDIPGIEQGTLSVNYGEEGFSMSGDFNLSSEIPGIQGGTVSARVGKEEGAEGYDIMISGTAQPDIPGIDSTLTVSYENGALTIEGQAAYERGMLSGNVRLGATNRTIGDDGQPTGEPDDTMRVYGGGDLTLQLTPWLEATAGVQFLPNGEIEVTGRIGLPNTVDVFDRREFNRNLFTVPTVEIPIFAIPLGPRSIGLVAQISGGLDFSAGFGPGQLREVNAEVTYNPDREDETEIHGHGEFAIPADAGLTLRGDLGLGVSVAIASLSGGIELAGTLGLEGEASAMVDLSWSPQTGVVLDAEGRITVNPKFVFDVNAFARASLGIGWFSISETWRYNLASFSWGPDIQFGIVFPVHYQQDQPFDISFDDIEVIYPDLDVIDMAKGLARNIKDDIFD